MHEELAVSIPMMFLFLAILLMVAKLGSLVTKFRQPEVVGELSAGILLSVAGFLGFSLVEAIRHNMAMEFIAELGAVILLFQIGLESNVQQMRQVGVRALMVALIGVLVPFVLGAFVVGPWLFPGQENITYLFIGSALVATSVGITAAVYQSVGTLKMKSSQTVLGAAVIDDVLGLLVLAVVSAMASGGEVTIMFVSTLVLKAVGFLAIAVLLGDYLATGLSKVFSSISTGHGMKLAMALSLALVFAYLASVVGLAPIVGAFAAGLILDKVHFDRFNQPEIVHELRSLGIVDEKAQAKIDSLIHRQDHAHVEELVRSIGYLIIPVFFVFIGLMVDAESLLNPSVYVTAVVLAAAAIVGKLVAGVAAEGSPLEKLYVGVSMIPRGEVGLIFAAVGKSLGVIPSDIFSTIILVIIITTVIPPSFISSLGHKLAASKNVSAVPTVDIVPVE